MRFFLTCLLMFSIFSCFRAPKPPKNVEEWLEKAFPGQFEVVTSNLKILDIMAQFRGDKQAVIGDKADPAVQFLLDWQKGTPSLGLDSNSVIEAHSLAKADVAKARQLFQQLKMGGLDKFSVGVVNGAAFVQVFCEPVSAFRAQLLGQLKNILDKPQDSQTSPIYLELLADSAYHTRYQDIVPRADWKTDGGWQRNHKIMALDIAWNHQLSVPALMRHWKLNLDSNNSLPDRDLAFEAAKDWADQHLPKPFFMYADQPYRVDIPENKGLHVRFGFPYFGQAFSTEGTDTLAPDPKGYVSGVYDWEGKAFSGWRREE